MINKVTQLEIVIEKLQSNIRMIKENYSITIEDNTAQQNIKLNNVMKVLAIITTIYAPFDIVASLFGMNIKVPFQDQESLWPFFGILMGLFVLFLCQLYLFKRLNWF
jgi:Mg2+ and Co2+ transporter CorA